MTGQPASCLIHRTFMRHCVAQGTHVKNQSHPNTESKDNIYIYARSMSTLQCSAVPYQRYPCWCAQYKTAQQSYTSTGPRSSTMARFYSSVSAELHHLGTEPCWPDYTGSRFGGSLLRAGLHFTA